MTAVDPPARAKASTMLAADRGIWQLIMSTRVVAFRTAPGTKLANAPMSHVTFEIDAYDSTTGVG